MHAWGGEDRILKDMRNEQKGISLRFLEMQRVEDKVMGVEHITASKKWDKVNKGGNFLKIVRKL